MTLRRAERIAFWAVLVLGLYAVPHIAQHVVQYALTHTTTEMPAWPARN